MQGKLSWRRRRAVRRARRTGRKLRAVGEIWIRNDQRSFQNVGPGRAVMHAGSFQTSLRDFDGTFWCSWKRDREAAIGILHDRIGNRDLPPCGRRHRGRRRLEDAIVILTLIDSASA